VGDEKLVAELALNDITLQPKKDFIHLGAKHNLAELNKKANNPMLKSSDVTFRIGTSRFIGWELWWLCWPVHAL
jgi:hypothetical protein